MRELQPRRTSIQRPSSIVVPRDGPLVAMSTAPGTAAASLQPRAAAPPRRRRRRRSMRSVTAALDDVLHLHGDECLISPHKCDSRTVYLAPNLTLVRQGLITPTMSSPIFRERECAVRGEEHMAHTNLLASSHALLRAVCCVAEAMLADKCIVQDGAIAVNALASMVTDEQRSDYTSRYWRQPLQIIWIYQMLSSVASTCAPGWVCRVLCCIRACLCPRAATASSPRPTVKPAVRSRSDLGAGGQRGEHAVEEAL